MQKPFIIFFLLFFLSSCSHTDFDQREELQEQNIDTTSVSVVENWSASGNVELTAEPRTDP